MNVEELVQDIHTRFEALSAQTDEARIAKIVKDTIGGLTDDDPFVRKMRFGTDDGDARLIGSKFARWGYTQADVEFLYDLMRASQGKRTNEGAHPGPSTELTRSFEAVSKAYYMTDAQIREIDRQAIDELYPRVPKHELRGMNREQWVEAQLRASSMDSGTSGYGSQLVGAQYVGNLWDAAFQEGRIAPLIPTFEMTAPTAYLPVAVDMPKMSYVSESTSDVIATAQYATIRTGSQRVSVTAKKEVIHQVWSTEMDEDSIIPYVPFLRMQAARGLSFWTDFIVLNGDTTTAGTGNINSDDAAPAATEPYLAFDGIRKAAIVDNTANVKNLAGAALNINTLRDLKNLMRDDTRYVDFGHPNNPTDLIFVGDVETADRIALIDEIVDAKTDGVGNTGSLLNGQVASFLGHPVIGTMAQSKTDTDYKYTTTSPSTADVYGQITAFNRNAFVLGYRRRLKVATEEIVGSDQSRIVYSTRLGLGRFTPTGAASGIEGAAIAGYIGL